VTDKPFEKFDWNERAPVTALTIARHLPPDFLARSLRADAARGLASTPKRLPPKWFYDKTGIALFDEITRLPGYYLTRAEREILGDHVGHIADLTRAETLVELGAGSAEKTRLLIEAMRASGTLRLYVPVDVSEFALVACGEALIGEYPGIEVHAMLADFERHIDLAPRSGRRLVAFLGSTIGNLDPDQRAAFFFAVRRGMRPGDAFLLGADLVKSPNVLVGAYDDPAGVTAAFNRNVLNVLNRELGADFDVDAFEHVACWDAQQEWVEMRLRSTVEQAVQIPEINLKARFAAGEMMRTEICAKFRRPGIEAELRAAGLDVVRWWTDSRDRFAVALAVPSRQVHVR
jgi:L-histidine Nalpha-methyltransferase